jgi:hypothetical protein
MDLCAAGGTHYKAGSQIVAARDCRAPTKFVWGPNYIAGTPLHGLPRALKRLTIGPLFVGRHLTAPFLSEA